MNFPNKMDSGSPVLYFVHDPMCSWCWGFRPVMQQLEAMLPDSVKLVYLAGGLAADSDEPMPDATRQYLQQTWASIQQRIPGTRFNFDFWTKCQPRRSTYPACRAVLAARMQNPLAEKTMIAAIQEAYYLEAKNPSDDSTLIELANQTGLDAAKFSYDLNSETIQKTLLEQIQFARQLGGDSFPSLILVQKNTVTKLVIDYNNAAPMLQQINDLLSEDRTDLTDSRS